MNNSKHIVKTLHNLLHSRGFENPSLVLKWDSFHSQAFNFFPVRLSCKSSNHQTLYVIPSNKSASIAFPYCKKDLLESLWNSGFFLIKDIALSSSK